MKNSVPFLVWLVFSLFLLGNILVIRPGWGLMDDSQNLRSASGFLNAGSTLTAYLSLVQDDISHNGRFRPFYFIWIVSAYSFFRGNPTLFYFFVALAGLLFLPLWGRLICSSYNRGGKNTQFLYWAYPVSFFFFTPFWNNFMYLSILEKFLYFFSPLAFGSFFLVFKKKTLYPFIAATAAAICGLLSKETGIFVFLSFFVFSCIAALLFRSHRPVALTLTIFSAIFLFAYYYFIKKIISFYSSRYEASSLVHNLIHSPVIIKALLIYAVMSATYYCRKSVRSGNIIDLFPVLWPISVVAYIFVLSPWGYMNYLLAPLGPCVMAMLYPLYACFWQDGKLKILKQSLFVMLCIVTMCGVIIPRTLQLASVKGITAFLHNDSGAYQYFFPSSSPETPLRLSELSGKEIQYPINMVLRKDDLIKDHAYMIFDRLSQSVTLVDLKPQTIVYKTDFWAVVEIVPAPTGMIRYGMQFPRTLIQRIIRKVKNA